ncbi:MAG: thiamine-phosphate kinase [Nitrososphaerota archaeon]|jgi:thiamine-monophosphate kinase|nr:thiamine-phosphate kinase [Nitrososphaerota archaeon]
MNENEIIDLFRRSFQANPDKDPGMFDDVAYLNEKGRLVVKVDMFVAETDMPPGMTLSQAARKSVIACLSDVSSKGAKAFAFSVSLGIPRRLANRKPIESLIAGFRQAGREYRLRLISGDINEAKDLVIDCVMLGRAGDIYVTRNGARPDDIVFSTGPFGYTGLGLKHLVEGLSIPSTIKRQCIDSVLEPKPNIWLSRSVVSSGLVSASMDSSDGLSATLNEIAFQSGVGMELDNLPVDKEIAESGLDRESVFDAVMFGGEEYATVFTVPPKNEEKISEIAKQSGGRLYRLGRVVQGGGVRLVYEGQIRRIRPAGWVHFAPRRMP